MIRKISREILLQFIEEARAHLPGMRRAVETALEDPTRLDALEEIHRQTHSIKGAAAMVGLSPLGHIAFYAEEAIEKIGLGDLSLDAASGSVLRETIEIIEQYLDGVASNTLQARTLLARAIGLFRRLQGLPEAGDAGELHRLLPPNQPVVGEPGGEAEDTDAGTATVIGASAASAPSSEMTVIPPDPTLRSQASVEFLEAFAQEAEEYLQGVNAQLRALDREGEDPERIQSLRRTIHTLKGAAATVGLNTVSQLAHRMEDLLDRLHEGRDSLTPDKLDLLFTTTDMLSDLTQEGADPTALRDTLDKIYADYEEILGETDFAPIHEVSGTPDGVLAPLGEEQVIDLEEMATLASPEGELAGEHLPTRPAPSQVVRVPIERLDEMVRLVSELMVTRSTFEQYHQQLAREVGELRLSMARLSRLSNRMETEYEVLALAGSPVLEAAAGADSAPQTAEAGSSVRSSTMQVGFSSPSAPDFHELELDRYTEFHLLSRELSETSSDIAAVSAELHDSVGDFDTYINRIARHTNEVQHKLMRLRMVPLATLASRLDRAVRVTARPQGKKVDLEIEGEHTAFDKTVLEEMADPLLHIMRNAVDHGIEPPALRQAQGKPERGTVRLRAFYEGTHVVIEVSDDGSGLEPDMLRSTAIERGMISAADAENLTLEELSSLIFLPGFSTAGQISEVSGRGVGLDVVKANVHRVKGSISLTSEPGRGTTFTIRLPMTLAIARGLMISTHGHTYAIPLAAVSQILRVDAEQIENLGTKPVIRVDDRVIPLLRLGEVLNLPPSSLETPRRWPILILKIGGKQVALVVERILQARDMVIKSLGSLLRKVHGVSAATLMGDGTVVLILNPSDLINVEATTRVEILSSSPGSGAAAAQPQAPPPSNTVDVLIVDDSVSVRKVLSSLISGMGWNPITAKDGVEALETLQGLPKPPDVILLDIEMPRMDGYELTSTLRGQKTYAQTPIVMLTSRAGEKHRHHAFELGATEYLVKPYRDETLINVIRRVIRSQP